jgi:putative ABC transport system substrate-binding protein
MKAEIVGLTAEDACEARTSPSRFHGSCASLGGVRAGLRELGYVEGQNPVKGAKANDLPIEQPTTFELVIGAKAARTLGLAIPHAVLVQADQIIE